MNNFYTKEMREDNQLLTLLHFSQLLNLITGFGGFIVPLILWVTQKNNVLGMDVHGKMILNFQLSLLIYGIICFPLILVFGLGIFLFFIVALLSIIFPIINGIKVSNGELPHYPFAIEIIK